MKVEKKNTVPTRSQQFLFHCISLQDHFTLFMQCWMLKVPDEIITSLVDAGLNIGARDKDGYCVRDKILLEKVADGSVQVRDLSLFTRGG